MPILSHERFVFCTDVDQTLLDFPLHFNNWMEQTHGVKALPDTQAITEQHDLILHRFPQFTRDTLEHELGAFCRSPLFEDMPVMPDLLEGWHALRDAFPNSLFFGLSSMGHNPITVRMRQCQLSTLDLDRFFPLDLYHPKAEAALELGAHLIFEDCPKQITHAMEKGLPTIGLDWPFNQHVTPTARMYNWRQAPHLAAQVLGLELRDVA